MSNDSGVQAGSQARVDERKKAKKWLNQVIEARRDDDRPIEASLGKHVHGLTHFAPDRQIFAALHCI